MKLKFKPAYLGLLTALTCCQTVCATELTSLVDQTSNLMPCAKETKQLIPAYDQDLQSLNYPDNPEANSSENIKDNLIRLGESSNEREIYKYIGNKFSNKFHRPWCPFEKAMNAHNALFFHFRHNAIAAGFKPCQYCLPLVVKRVRCVLLPSRPR